MLHAEGVPSRDSRFYLLTPLTKPAPPPTPPKIVTPPFDAAFGDSRAAVCIDASKSHAHGEENNTRWTFYAIPKGQPPAGGWPILFSLMPWLDDPYIGNANVSVHGNRTCGNGWTANGYFGVECLELLRRPVRKPPLATKNLLEDTDGLRRPPLYDAIHQ